MAYNKACILCIHLWLVTWYTLRNMVIILLVEPLNQINKFIFLDYSSVLLICVNTKEIINYACCMELLGIDDRRVCVSATGAISETRTHLTEIVIHLAETVIRYSYMYTQLY